MEPVTLTLLAIAGYQWLKSRKSTPAGAQATASAIEQLAADIESRGMAAINEITSQIQGQITALGMKTGGQGSPAGFTAYVVAEGTGLPPWITSSQLSSLSTLWNQYIHASQAANSDSVFSHAEAADMIARAQAMASILIDIAEAKDLFMAQKKTL